MGGQEPSCEHPWGQHTAMLGTGDISLLHPLHLLRIEKPTTNRIIPLSEGCFSVVQGANTGKT